MQYKWEASFCGFCILCGHFPLRRPRRHRFSSISALFRSFLFTFQWSRHHPPDLEFNHLRHLCFFWLFRYNYHIQESFFPSSSTLRGPFFDFACWPNAKVAPISFEHCLSSPPPTLYQSGNVDREKRSSLSNIMFASTKHYLSSEIIS